MHFLLILFYPEVCDSIKDSETEKTCKYKSLAEKRGMTNVHIQVVRFLLPCHYSNEECLKISRNG